MVAESSSPPTGGSIPAGDSPRLKQDDVEQAEQEEIARGRGGIRHLLAAATRLASLQYRIIMAKVKITMVRIAISTGLYLGAAVFGILAVIFLFIAIFHALLLVLPVWAAYLVFAVGMAVVAGVMVLLASRMLSKKVDDDDEDDDDQEDDK